MTLRINSEISWLQERTSFVSEMNLIDEDDKLKTLVNILQTTSSPISMLRHYPDIGLPHY